jgi:hypothetical protein
MKFTTITAKDGTTFATTNGENLMARYSRALKPGCFQAPNELLKRVDFQYKNTLLTLSVGDTIYWGISRCNLDMGDRFSKVEGRSRALLRLLHAREFYQRLDDLERKPVVASPELASKVIDPATRNSTGMLWGWCDKSHLNTLLGHFFNLDEMFEKERQARYARYRLEHKEKQEKKRQLALAEAMAASPNTSGAEYATALGNSSSP